MELNNQDILFASLMGSNAVGLIQRLNLVQNDLQKRVLLPIPFLPLQNRVLIEQASDYEYQDSWTTNDIVYEGKQFFPLSFSFTEGGQKWLFPFEPMINTSSGNNIIKRNVAKQGEKLIGTIKERWSRKDFEIQVTGVLMGNMLQGTPEQTFPREQMERLFEFLKHSKEFFIYCHPLEILGITKVVVEDYSFPFTKGENVQAYDLKLISDFAYNLLIKEEF